MKILLINPLDYRYGSTYRTRTIASSLRQAGLLDKYVESNYEGEKADIISIHQPDTIKGYVLASFRRFQICLFQKYDMLFLQNFTPLTFFCLVAAKLRLRKIIVDWDAFEFMFQKTIFRRVLTFFIEFICPYFVYYITSPSSYLINNIKKRGISRIIKVPHCIDTSFFQPDEFKRKKMRKKMNLADKIIIGYLCAFNPGGIRDLDNILRVFKNVSLKRADVFLLVIGEGTLEYKAQRLIQHYGIDNFHIVNIKSQERVVECLNITDICLIYLKNDIGSLMRTSIKLLIYLSMNKTVIGRLLGESKDAFGGYVVSSGPKNEDISNDILNFIQNGNCANYNLSRDFITANYDSRMMGKYLNNMLGLLQSK